MRELEIDISQLKLVIDRIFEQIQSQTEIRRFRVDHDYYWRISDPDIHDVSARPNVEEIGQLFEDWDFLKSVLEDERDAVPLMLRHVAPLVRYMATNVDWYGERQERP